MTKQDFRDPIIIRELKIFSKQKHFGEPFIYFFFFEIRILSRLLFVTFDV